jgi:O-antigen/teichoic acid export membrane protein
MDNSACSESPTKRLLRHSGWLLAAQLVASVSTIVQALIVTRALGATSYGIYVLVIASVAFVNRLFDSRVWQAVAKYVPEFRASHQHDKATAVFQLCMLVEGTAALLAWCVVMILAGYAAALIPGDNESLIRLYAFVPLINMMVDPLRSLLQVAGKFRWLTIQTCVNAGVQTTGVAAVWYLGPTIERVLLVQMCAAGAGLVLLLAMGTAAACELKMPFWRLSLLSSLSGHFRGVLRFMFLTNLTTTTAILNSVDCLLLALFVTPAAVGGYELAKKIVAHLNRIAKPIHQAVYHEFSAMISNRRFEDVARLQQKITIRLLACVVPICLTVTLVAPRVIPFVFGAEFTASVSVLQILIWQLLILPLCWFRGFMLCIDKVGIMTWVTTSLALMLPVLMLLLIPPFGIIGASLASLTCTLVWIVIVALLVRRFDLPFLYTKYGTCKSSVAGPVRSAA